MNNYEEYLKLAEIYQAYSLVSNYIESTNRLVPAGDDLYLESVFNASRFLVNSLGGRTPNGINIVSVFYTMATLGYKQMAYKTAREGYEKLLTLRVP